MTRPDAKDDGEVPQKGWIESLLESLEMVQWDRFVRAEDDKLGVYFDIYGWIDRDEDAYKDFILLRVFPETDENLRMFTTSSDYYHDEINEILFGDTSESNHCQRVEHTFEVPNVVKIDEPELATDGGRVEDADGVDQKTCTIKTCDRPAEWALWMGDDFSRVRDPHPVREYVDGDIHPFVCSSCRESGVFAHSDMEFVRPEEKLIADGGEVESGPVKIPGGTGEWYECLNCRGRGEVVGCYDDICHAQGRCMHDGNDPCFECEGTGRVWSWYDETLERHPELKDGDRDE